MRISTSSPEPARSAALAKSIGGAGIGRQLQLLVFLIAAAAVVSRRPDALFNPQFFGEDGTIWYRDAYVFGWLTSLLHSQNGYFQTLPRLAAALAIAVPLRFAPLVMNIIGITVQVLPANILLSSRCRNWAPLSVRAFMAIAYLALPNTRELDTTVEEGQWHLALLACLLILACVPENLGSRVFDTTVFLLSGVTGPFGLILLPVSAIFWWLRRERWRLTSIAVLATTSVLQLSALFRSASETRPHVILGATPKLFVQILAKQVYLGALLGESALSIHERALILSGVALLGTSILLYCLARARWELKLFILFSGAVFAAALINPMVSETVPQWQILILQGGIRYWFFPMLAFVWALIYCVSFISSWFIRVVAAAGLFAMSIGIPNDWRYPAYTDFDFPGHAKGFASAAPGTLVPIPICPDGWVVRLTKKNPLCRTPPIGEIDRPREAAHGSGLVSVAGWVAASEPIQSVSIYLDRALVQSIKPNFVRPDVDSFYPHSPGKYKGWEVMVDMSKTTAGQHEIEARGLEVDGCEADFYIVGIERIK